MRNKIVTATEAVAVVQTGDALCTSGFVRIGVPDALLVALEKRFLETGEPRDLTLLFAAGQGDGKDRGLNALGHDGLLKRVVGGHWGLIPKVGRLALEGNIEAYNLPQGVISHLYRDIAAGKPGTLSRVGIGTFVDPRIEGGRINEVTTEDLIRVINIDGREWLFYRGFPLNVAFLRGTTADPNGNVTAEREALDIDNLAMAMAVKNSGGVVIVQVERIALAGSLHPRQVLVPGSLVDCVVVSDPEHHRQTYATVYCRADHVQRPGGCGPGQAGALRHRALRVPAAPGRAGAGGGRAGDRSRSGRSGPDEVPADRSGRSVDGPAYLPSRADGLAGAHARSRSHRPARLRSRAQYPIPQLRGALRASARGRGGDPGGGCGAMPNDRPPDSGGGELRRLPAGPSRGGPYAEMVRSLEEAFYTRVARHTTSAFMRAKLGHILTRTVRPHIFESKAEAQAFHENILST
jgi:acyl CoA:acetate/3-ketoacid CoA transferase alpha subunit